MIWAASWSATVADEYNYHPSITMRLGAGVDPSDPTQPFPYCFKFAVQTIGGTAGSAQFKLRQISTRRELLAEMNASASLSGRFKFFSGGAKAAVDESYSFTSDSLTWIVSMRSEFGRREIVSEELLPTFAQMLNAKEYDKFSDRCGKQLVTQERREAAVAAIFTVTNVSESRRKSLQTSLDAAVQTGVFSVEGSGQYRSFVAEAAKSSAINVRVETLGGPGGGALAPLVTDYGDIQKVADTLRKYIEATTSANALATSYNATDMKRYGWQGSPFDVSQIDQSLADYYVFYQDVGAVRDRASTIIRNVALGKVELSSAEVDELKRVERAADSEMRKILATAKKCRVAESECVSATDFSRPTTEWPNPDPLGDVWVFKDDVTCQDIGPVTANARFMCTRSVMLRAVTRPKQVQSVTIFDENGTKIPSDLGAPQDVKAAIEQGVYLARSVTPVKSQVTTSYTDALDYAGIKPGREAEWKIQPVGFQTVFGTSDVSGKANPRIFTLRVTDQNGSKYERSVLLN